MILFLVDVKSLIPVRGVLQRDEDRPIGRSLVTDQVDATQGMVKGNGGFPGSVQI